MNVLNDIVLITHKISPGMNWDMSRSQYDVLIGFPVN